MAEKIDAELGIEAMEAMLAASYCLGWDEAIKVAAEIAACGFPPRSNEAIYVEAAIRKLKK